ncbi:hypothetical protein KKE26_07155 [bacterium]|nr:hypothetical protein [bacterium]
MLWFKAVCHGAANDTTCVTIQMCNKGEKGKMGKWGKLIGVRIFLILYSHQFSLFSISPYLTHLDS